MYNSQYYTCEQIDQRLLQGYLDDYNSQNNTNLTKAEFLTLLFNTIGRNSTLDNLVTQIGYYECDTAGATAAKVITIVNYNLFAGGSMKVKFANKNTANNATLNINGKGAKALYYQGERASANNSWDAEEVVEIYYDGTSYYANNVKGGSGSGVYDVSKEHPTSGPNSDGKFTLEYILNSSNVNELIPVNKRYPGMSIQFVSTSDNKYVQYRLMKNTFSTTVSDWQGVDNEPTVGSDNLVKSGGVDKAIYKHACKLHESENVYNQRIEYNTNLAVGTRDQGADTPSDYRVRNSTFFPIVGDKIRVYIPNDKYRVELDFYSGQTEDTFISVVGYLTESQLVSIPSNAKYLRLLFSPKSGVVVNYRAVGVPYDISIGIFVHSLENALLYKKIDDTKTEVKGEIAALKNEISTIGIIPGYYLNTNGVLVADNDYFVTDFIPVPSNCAQFIWRVGERPEDDIQMCAFDITKTTRLNYWGIQTIGGQYQRTINITTGAYAYVRASFKINKIDDSWLKDGTNDTILYTPFFHTIKGLQSLLKKEEQTITNIKLLSYNIRCLRGGSNTDPIPYSDPLTEQQITETKVNFKTLLSKIKPDIFVCCENRVFFDLGAGETTGGTRNVYDELWKHYFPYGKNINGGSYLPVIYSKYNVVDSGQIDVTYPSGVTDTRKPQYIKIDVLGKEIYVIGVHPAADASAKVEHREPYFQAVVNFCADKDRVIIAGDFNTDSSNPSSELNVFRNAGFELGNFGYFGQFATFRFGTDVYIDNVATKGVIINDFTVGTEDYSDHYPIESTISVL